MIHQVNNNDADDGGDDHNDDDYDVVEHAVYVDSDDEDYVIRQEDHLDNMYVGLSC